MTSPAEIQFKGHFLYAFANLSSATCRFRVSGEDRLVNAIESGLPLIGTSWHGMTMMVIGTIRKYVDLRSVVTIIPDDWRGDILEIFLNHLGIFPEKLSMDGDHSFESSRKLVRIIKQVSSGRYFLIHPDGPAGPAYRVKPGLTAIAQKTGALIVPIGGYCRHAYHWHRWDRYAWPLPFSRIQLHVGEPLKVPPDLQDLDGFNQDMEKILNRVAFQAAADYYQ